MALYLGSQKVNPTILKTIENTIIIDTNTNEPVEGHYISDNDWAQLQSAVNYRTGSDASNLSLNQQLAALNRHYLIETTHDNMKYSFSDTWTRPQTWPNLDSLNLNYSGETDFIYMTYDTTQGECAVALHIEAVSGGTPISVKIGHISNNAFVADETITGSSNNYVKWFDQPTSYSNGFPVVQVLGDISIFYGYEVTRDTKKQAFRSQPIVERVAYVPHLTKFCNGYTTQAWGMLSLEREKIANGAGTALTSTYYAWAYCGNLQSLDLSQFTVTNKVTTAACTFIRCFKLKNLDLSSWDVSNVTTCSSMFENCRSLISLNLTGWVTTKLNNMASMFNNCYSLKNIPGINNFNTTLVTTLASTFANCRSLMELDLTNWRTPAVTTLASTFTTCYCLTSLNLSNWDVSNVTTCASTFYYCRSLKLLNLTGWNLVKVTTIGSMFRDCISLQKLDLSGFHIDNKCTSIYNAFGYCISLKELSFPTWTLTGLGSGSNTANSLFSNCWGLETITGISNWNFSSLNNSLASMFQDCRSLKTLDISGWNVSTATSFASMFANCYSLEQLNLSSWVVSSKCTTIGSMFSDCHSLKSIGNISSWDTSNCATLSSVFYNCLALQSCPNIAGWDLKKATTLANMFNGCTSFKEVTLQNLNLPKCTTMATMFRYCYGLERVNLSGWTLSAMTTAPAEFLGDCWSLRYIDGITIPPLNMSFVNSDNLTKESLDTILDSLPNTATVRTLKLGATNNNRYTATERSTIKTNKNWTVSA